VPDDPPAWFTDALEQPGTPGAVTVHGATVRYLAWGDPVAPPLVLVHGGAAHARWWAPLAPLLARDRRVVALDLTGHGESDPRPRYDAEVWAEEVLAVAGDATAGRPVVVGHSMGGFVTIVAAARHGADLEGAVVLDSPVRRSDPESAEARRDGRNMFRAPKVYPDLDTALEHFHLVPPQPTRNPWLLDHVGRNSLRPVDDRDPTSGWRWKFDPGVFVHRSGPNRPSDYSADLARAACRMAIVNGERSAIVDDDVIDHMREMVAGSPAAAAGVPFVQVPDAHHHLLLDEPLATITAIRAILATWAPVGAAPRTVG
jgi:pimeloyl-ACP methyl ester carboxylesterase